MFGMLQKTSVDFFCFCISVFCFSVNGMTQSPTNKQNTVLCAPNQTFLEETVYTGALPYRPLTWQQPTYLILDQLFDHRVSQEFDRHRIEKTTITTNKIIYVDNLMFTPFFNT